MIYDSPTHDFLFSCFQLSCHETHAEITALILMHIQQVYLEYILDWNIKIPRRFRLDLLLIHVLFWFGFSFASRLSKFSFY